MNTLYIDSLIHAQPHHSVFFKKIKQLGDNPSRRIAILITPPVFSSFLDFLQESGLGITSDPKDTTKPIFLTISADNILNKKSSVTPRSKGFSSVFIIDSLGTLPPPFIETVIKDVDVYYLTTVKAFDSLIVNSFAGNSTYCINTTALHSSRAMTALSALSPQLALFLKELAKANLQEQEFYSPANFLFASKNKPLRIIKAETDEVSEIETKDIVLPSPFGKVAALTSLDEAVQRKETHSAHKGLQEVLGEFRKTLEPVLGELAMVSELSREVAEVRGLLSRTIEQYGQIDSKLTHVETATAYDYDPDEDILKAFRDSSR